MIKSITDDELRRLLDEPASMQTAKLRQDCRIALGLSARHRRRDDRDAARARVAAALAQREACGGRR